MSLNRAVISHPGQPSVEIDVTKPDYQKKINAANDMFKSRRTADRGKTIIRESGKPDIIGTEEDAQLQLQARRSAEQGK